ncbi:MAG: class I SAM-dependent methyltransferase [Dethiobacter sp.]|jgi:predicted RNA methylase|nr:class I SAM-dependent methyltransferase [Dethiobacter sp.]
MWMYILLAMAALLFGSIVLPSFWGGAWSPTPMHIVNQMLEMANFREGETLFDLGAGDGRVIIKAASTYPIKAVGVEIDPFKCFLLKLRVRLKGLGGRVRIINKDFFKTDLSAADVVFLYLSPVAHQRLSEKIIKELRNGARVVSYRRTMSGLPLKAVRPQNLYLYSIGQDATQTNVDVL